MTGREALDDARVQRPVLDVCLLALAHDRCDGDPDGEEHEECGDDGDDDEVDQDFYAGGGKSGLAVQNPDDLKKKIIEKAKK